MKLNRELVAHIDTFSTIAVYKIRAPKMNKKNTSQFDSHAHTKPDEGGQALAAGRRCVVFFRKKKIIQNMWKIEEKYEHERVRGSGQNLIIEKNSQFRYEGIGRLLKRKRAQLHDTTHTHTTTTHTTWLACEEYSSSLLVHIWAILACVCVCVCVMATQTNHMNWIDGNDDGRFFVCARGWQQRHIFYTNTYTLMFIYLYVYI